MRLETLNELHDDDLRAVIGQCEELLALHDKERKTKAMEDARAVLALAGLTLKDLTKAKGKPAKGQLYKGGHSYQHPGNKALVWAAKGKKPHWLVELEAEGGKAMEIPGGSGKR